MVDLLIPGAKDIENITWKPFPKQELFLSLPDTIKEGFYGGGAGSAKTETLVMYPIVRGWYEHPRFKQLFLRRTFPELKNEVVPRTKQIYPKFGATWNGQDMAWTFPSPDQYGAGLRGNAGATIFLGHCETEDDVHRYDSMEINLFSPDELTSATEWIYLYIGFTRTRAPEDSGLPAIIRAGGMPGNIGHTWVKKRFVDPAKEGNVIIVGRGGNKRIYIHATFRDNPHLDKTYGTSLEALPEAEKQAKLGNWDAFIGQVYDEFRDRLYPDEPENALHVIDDFAIPHWWPKFVVGDWGYEAMCYVGFFAVAPSGRVYLYRELHWFKTKISAWAPELKWFVDSDQPRSVKFCKSASQDRGQEHTIQEQIETELGRPIDLSVNTTGSRLAGKMLVHEYLRWKEKPILPANEMPVYDEGYAQWILRNKSPKDYQNYLALFNPPEVEDNLPKLQIFKSCPLMSEAIKSCFYAKAGKDGKPPEDVAEFPGDDPYDALRYALDSAESYFTESADEFINVQRQQKLLETLKNTNDWTAFYRNMNTIESSTSTMQVVRKYHRGRR